MRRETPAGWPPIVIIESEEPQFDMPWLSHGAKRALLAFAFGLLVGTLL